MKWRHLKQTTLKLSPPEREALVGVIDLHLTQQKEAIDRTVEDPNLDMDELLDVHADIRDEIELLEGVKGRIEQGT